MRPGLADSCGPHVGGGKAGELSPAWAIEARETVGPGPGVVPIKGTSALAPRVPILGISADQKSGGSGCTSGSRLEGPHVRAREQAQRDVPKVVGPHV